jgi:hypothetical protein
MKLTKTTIALAFGTMFSAAALAQSVGDYAQRDVNQQSRIEQGLQSGALNTREAARLEGEEARVERMQANALRDGRLSDAERARLNRAENRVSRDIYREKHDGQFGNPNSPSSQRMQADVQRNINQENRILQGVQNGSLTNREVGKLERGQARTNALQARAGRDGRVGPHEQRNIQAAQNRQSRHIWREKHDGQVRSIGGRN